MLERRTYLLPTRTPLIRSDREIVKPLAVKQRERQDDCIRAIWMYSHLIAEEQATLRRADYVIQRQAWRRDSFLRLKALEREMAAV